MDSGGFKLVRFSNNQYTFSEFVRTAYSLILTKCFYPRARLIRRPFFIRGKSSLKYNYGLTTGYNCRLDLAGNKNFTLLIGENCEVGDNVHIVAHNKVEIGDNVLIASKVFISDTSHGKYKGENQDSPLIKPNDRSLVTSSVKIGNNVWIGENAVILQGVTIGNGAIIGSNSVVSKDVSANTIAVGAPAISIKKFNFETNIWEKIL